jgi:tripartite-type tricarboxylate transporter receptor subunit TctC
LDRRTFCKLPAAAVGLGAMKFATAADAPIYKLIVPFAAGGGTDIIARALLEQLRSSTNANWIVENVAGANGAVGAAALARSEPDGRTVSMFSPGIQITNEFLYEKLPYDPLKDFAPVVMVAKLPNLLVVNNELPVKNVAELIGYAKANPGKLNFYSSGKGASSHLAAELFMQMSGLKMTHVPYKGSAPGLVDLMAGRVHLSFDSMTVLLSKVEGGAIRALAVTTDKRLSYLPDIPTVAETLPGFEGSSMVYMAARAGTPEAQIMKVNEAFNKALAYPPIAARYKELGLAPPIGGTPADLRNVIASERVKWKRVIEATGLEKSAI